MVVWQLQSPNYSFPPHSVTFCMCVTQVKSLLYSQLKSPLAGLRWPGSLHRGQSLVRSPMWLVLDQGLCTQVKVLWLVCVRVKVQPESRAGYPLQAHLYTSRFCRHDWASHDLAIFHDMLNSCQAGTTWNLIDSNRIFGWLKLWMMLIDDWGYSVDYAKASRLHPKWMAGCSWPKYRDFEAEAKLCSCQLAPPPWHLYHYCLIVILGQTAIQRSPSRILGQVIVGQTALRDFHLES